MVPFLSFRGECCLLFKEETPFAVFCLLLFLICSHHLNWLCFFFLVVSCVLWQFQPCWYLLALMGVHLLLVVVNPLDLDQSLLARPCLRELCTSVSQRMVQRVRREEEWAI